MIRKRLTTAVAALGIAVALSATAVAAGGPSITTLKTKQSGNKVTATVISTPSLDSDELKFFRRFLPTMDSSGKTP